MGHYKITEEFRKELNNFLGTEYLNPTDVGHELPPIHNYETIANVPPEKVNLLVATLFPEELNDNFYLSSHGNEIAALGKKLHVAPSLFPTSWTHYLVQREWLPNETSQKLSERNFFVRLFW